VSSPYSHEVSWSGRELSWLWPAAIARILVLLGFSTGFYRGTPVAFSRGMNTLVANVETGGSLTDPVSWVVAHGDYLFNFAVGQVRDAGVAEDLVQDTFAAAFKARERFEGKCSERTWLVGILRHKIYDHLRYACRERAVRSEELPREDEDESMMWIHQVAHECVHPTRRMELAEFKENLEHAMGTLPPRIAQVFQLYEIEELPNREVCAQLNISESNLWVMLHRARKQLRTQLEGWWSGTNERKN
jgi:RNA polymerase sigma-70 factor (ECF subfamily)